MPGVTTLRGSFRALGRITSLVLTEALRISLDLIVSIVGIAFLLLALGIILSSLGITTPRL